jgi:hypothetical protein
MDSTKPWYQSTGVWGSLVAIGAGTAATFGYTVSPDDQNAISQTLAQGGGLVSSAITVVSGAVALYGRIRATHKVTA